MSALCQKQTSVPSSVRLSPDFVNCRTRLRNQKHDHLALPVAAASAAERDNCGSRGRRLSSGDGLAYFEALKFRMLQIERPSCLITGTRVRGPKFFRLNPRLEGPLVPPHAVRGIERMVFCLRPLKQMKFQETRNTIEIVSRPSHTFSNLSSEPFFTRNRFMAMNMLGLLFLSFFFQGE